MFSLLGFVLLSSSLNFVWTATQYEDCGSALGTIQSFDVTDCTTTPCKFIKGEAYTINIKFQAKAASKTATLTLYGVLPSKSVPVPLPESDVCQLGAKCPIGENDVNTVSITIPMLSSYPSLSVTMKLVIKTDDLIQNYACLQAPVTLTAG